MISTGARPLASLSKCFADRILPAQPVPTASAGDGRHRSMVSIQPMELGLRGYELRGLRVPNQTSTAEQAQYEHQHQVQVTVKAAVGHGAIPSAREMSRNT